SDVDYFLDSHYLEDEKSRFTGIIVLFAKPQRIPRLQDLCLQAMHEQGEEYKIQTSLFIRTNQLEVLLNPLDLEYDVYISIAKRDWRLLAFPYIISFNPLFDPHYPWYFPRWLDDSCSSIQWREKKKPDKT